MGRVGLQSGVAFLFLCASLQDPPSELCRSTATPSSASFPPPPLPSPPPLPIPTPPPLPTPPPPPVGCTTFGGPPALAQPSQAGSRPRPSPTTRGTRQESNHCSRTHVNSELITNHAARVARPPRAASPSVDHCHRDSIQQSAAGGTESERSPHWLIGSQGLGT